MTIGIPTMMNFQSSTVSDPSTTLDTLLENCEPPVFDKDLKVRSGEWVYEYISDISFIPKIWNIHDENKGVYQLDEIVLKDCKLQKIVGRSGTGITYHQRPKEPENYSGHDTTMSYKGWAHRYVKITAAVRCSWLERVWTYDNRQYTINFSDGKHKWCARDLNSNYGSPVVLNTIRTSQKFNASTDTMARIIKWGITTPTRQDTLQINSMVERGGFFYVRTHLNLPLEYETWTTGSSFQYSYSVVATPADIDGFIKANRINPLQPFDGKSYTKTVFDTTDTDGEAKWVLYAVEDFDSIAFGRVIADSIDMIITDQDGQTVNFEITSYDVDNSIAKGRPEQYPETVILYTEDTMKAGSIITIILQGAVVELGEMVAASKLDSGFTKLAFKNKYKDFSPKEQDQWGNYFYRDGVRVHVHSGTVEFPIVSYDMMSRLMIYVGGRKIILNSSDTIKNELPDGYNIFSATMLIGRFTSFELATSEKNKHIGDIARYNFQIEELV